MANNTTHKDELAASLMLSARKRDTLHMLILVLRQQAQARGDITTLRLVDNVLARQGEGDKLKRELLDLFER
jgi:hypothetical protein